MSADVIAACAVYHHSVPGARGFASLEVAPWTAKAERNGNPILPDDVYRVLLEECDKRPGPAQHHTFGELLNAVAWRTRHLGMGLSRKTGGQRVDSPVGEIAEDIICHTSGHHWDVLGGAAVGQPLRPGQGPSIGIIDLRARPWVAPVEPTGNGQGIPDSSTPTPPAPTPAPPPVPPSTDLAVLKAQMAAILDVLHVVLQAVASSATREQVEQLRARILDGGTPVPSVLEHIDDAKRIAAGVERDPRFL
jgi:hypothetical protein